MAKHLALFLVLIVAAFVFPAVYDASIIGSTSDSESDLGGSIGRDFNRLNRGQKTVLTQKGVHVFQTEEELAESIAKDIAELSDKIIKEKGKFTVVLSGGYLIDSLRKLMEPRYAKSINWSKWYVFWLDERCVPRDHIDSNFRLAMDGFMSKVPIVIGNVYGINDTLVDLPEKAAENYETQLKALADNGVIEKTLEGYPKFDLMLLGMGPDGHIASLFPNRPQINITNTWVTYIEDSPKPPPRRITMTLPVINASPYVAFIMVGNGEAKAVCITLGKCESPTILPAQRVLPDGQLKWFLDKDAASEMLDI